MGLKPERMSIAKITVDHATGRSFLSQIGAKLELELIDLVKTINIEPNPLSKVESKTLSLLENFSGLNDFIITDKKT